MGNEHFSRSDCRPRTPPGMSAHDRSTQRMQFQADSMGPGFIRFLLLSLFITLPQDNTWKYWMNQNTFFIGTPTQFYNNRKTILKVKTIRIDGSNRSATYKHSNSCMNTTSLKDNTMAQSIQAMEQLIQTTELFQSQFQTYKQTFY